MDKNYKVKVTSNLIGTVRVSLPFLNFRRDWPAKGSTAMIPFGILEEGIFDPGFYNLLSTGDLYIEDMAVKKALGLEPEDATTPTNIIVLDENKIIFLLKTATLEQLEETLKQVSFEQACNLARYAISHEINNFEKAEIIKKYSNIDITKNILLNRQDKE